MTGKKPFGEAGYEIKFGTDLGSYEQNLSGLKKYLNL